MPKYAATVSLKRKGERFPAGSTFTDLTKEEVKELRAAKAIVFVPPTEEEEDDAAKGGKAPAKNPATPPAA